MPEGGSDITRQSSSSHSFFNSRPPEAPSNSSIAFQSASSKSCQVDKSGLNNSSTAYQSSSSSSFQVNGGSGITRQSSSSHSFFNRRPPEAPSNGSTAFQSSSSNSCQVNTGLGTSGTYTCAARTNTSSASFTSGQRNINSNACNCKDATYRYKYSIQVAIQHSG